MEEVATFGCRGDVLSGRGSLFGGRRYNCHWWWGMKVFENGRIWGRESLKEGEE